MRRMLAVATFAVVSNASLLFLVPGPASAEAPAGAIRAEASKVFLGHDPWTPTGNLTVSVRNEGATAAEGFFVLHLPHSVRLESSPDCLPADGPEQPAWHCGGAMIAPGGSRDYELQVTSTTLEPVFEVQIEGWVEGKSADGRHGDRGTFVIAWPDRLPLRLAASVAGRTRGHVDVHVRVTNAGTFTLGGYSLNVRTPAGVRVVSPACSDSGRMSDVGCELLRVGPFNAGTTDAFTIRLSHRYARGTLDMWLAPSNRYINDDTSVSLRIGVPIRSLR